MQYQSLILISSCIPLSPRVRSTPSPRAAKRSGERVGVGGRFPLTRIEIVGRVLRPLPARGARARAAPPQIEMYARSKSEDQQRSVPGWPVIQSSQDDDMQHLASRAGVWVRLSQPARSLMTLGVTATHDSASLGPTRWLFALRRTRLVLIAAAVAFGVLWMVGMIAAAPALAGFAALAAAALMAAVNTEAAPASLTKDEPSAPGVADPLIQTVLSALPDPVVALDHRGDVVALNARAAAIAPALRPGESVSLGLRVPEVLDGIRSAR